MKRITSMLYVAALLISMTACAQKNNGNSNTQNNNNMKKTLVAYFSATGTTKAAAEQLAKEKNADLFEIIPEQKYTTADLDWTNKQSRSSVEMKDLSSRPAVSSHIDNIDQYDTIYIGFPIWWYTAPTIINTFIEAYDFSGKVLGAFATSGGSTITKSANDLKKAYPQYTWLEGRLMN
jgi:flavodoxin